MRKKNLWNRGAGLLVILPLALSLSACDGGSSGNNRDLYEADEETPTPTEKAEEQPTEADPTPEPDIEPIQEAKPDYEEIYAPVLQENLDAIQNGYDYDKEYDYISNGMLEKIMYSDKDVLLDSIGYAIVDVTGDGIPELLIGENAAFDEMDDKESSYIYAGFTCLDGEPVWMIEGWARNSIRWMGDGKFFNFGSSGASHSSFGEFHMNNDGTVMIWDDFYFTDEKASDLAYYHNNEGIPDPDISEELNISGVDFWKIADDFKMQKIAFKSIDSFKGAVTTATGGSASNTKQSAEPIVGSWGLRSYVNMDIKDYIVFEDGTWLAVETMPSYTVDGSLTKSTGLCGTWEEGRGGSAGYYAYNLLDENGDLYEPVLVYEDEDGYMVMNFTGNMQFYYSDFYVPEEIAGSWTTPRGTEIVFDDQYNWTYYDDEGNFILGGHCVIDSGPGYEYLRLHTLAGDTGNIVFAEGKFYEDNTGYNVIDMKYNPVFKDMTGNGATYSKSY
ncbi:MAG: hypothetical protein IKR23_11000 [Lachnospiraceae bacterium]|nr:hypothetical protein [Lachnospiraceae bacterium]